MGVELAGVDTLLNILECSAAAAHEYCEFQGWPLCGLVVIECHNDYDITHDDTMRDHPLAFPQKTDVHPQRVTRLAPSPTGALHLGNARTFLINWALARQSNWQIVFRIEDLDGPRIKPDADTMAIQDLTWLGIDWDAGPYYQRVDLDIYQTALNRLEQAGLAYRCVCTRREIMNALSAPHADDHDMRYPGTCRPPAVGSKAEPVHIADADETAWRLLVADDEKAVVRFTDQLHGPQCVDVQQQSGDFVIWTKAGLPSYQLAVVVDDMRQGVTDVVRGDDLLSSTARQLLLYEALAGDTGKQPPRWWHLPMVIGPDGRRLAKRHGDSRVAWYREQGVSAEKIIGLIASWSGICQTPQPMDTKTFAQSFDISKLPREPVTFTAEMHQWLLA